MIRILWINDDHGKSHTALNAWSRRYSLITTPQIMTRMTTKLIYVIIMLDMIPRQRALAQYKRHILWERLFEWYIHDYDCDRTRPEERPLTQRGVSHESTFSQHIYAAAVYWLQALAQSSRYAWPASPLAYSTSDGPAATVLRDKRAGDVSPRHHFPIAHHRLSARLTPIQEPSRDITQLEIAVCNTRRVNGYPITR